MILLRNSHQLFFIVSFFGTVFGNPTQSNSLYYVLIEKFKKNFCLKIINDFNLDRLECPCTFEHGILLCNQPDTIQNFPQDIFEFCPDLTSNPGTYIQKSIGKLIKIL